MESKKIISLDSILSGEAKIEELNLSAPVHNVLMRMRWPIAALPSTR